MTEETVGVERTAEGTIVDQTPASVTEPSTQTTTSQPTTETKPVVETKPADGKTLLTEGKTEQKTETKTEAKTDDKVPDKYADYKVPDGYTLDPEVKTEADKIFKDLGLNQDQAQSLVDFYTSKTTEAFQAPFEAYKTMTDGWRQEAENHPDLRGKLGEGKDVNVRLAKMYTTIGDPKLVDDFKQAMDLTGVGNHPAFIRLLDKLAQRVTEGTHVSGNGPAKEGQSRPGEAPPTVGGALWPNLPSSMNR